MLDYWCKLWCRMTGFWKQGDILFINLGLPKSRYWLLICHAPWKRSLEIENIRMDYKICNHLVLGISLINEKMSWWLLSTRNQCSLFPLAPAPKGKKIMYMTILNSNKFWRHIYMHNGNKWPEIPNIFNHKLSQLHKTKKEGFQSEFGNAFYFFFCFVFVCIAFENDP